MGSYSILHPLVILALLSYFVLICLPLGVAWASPSLGFVIFFLQNMSAFYDTYFINISTRRKI
jgi:hypothetical protein